MSISQGTNVGIKGIGGYLNLRQNTDSNKVESIKSANKERNKSHLKEMLSKRFFNKHGLNQLGLKNERITQLLM